jgi:hypothetical protein
MALLRFAPNFEASSYKVRVALSLAIPETLSATADEVIQ